MIDHVKIGNIPFNVHLANGIPSKDEDRGPKAYGEAFYHEGNIFIEDSQCEAQKRQVLMHECIHVILEQTGHAITVSEDTIVALGYGVTMLLQNNPQLVAYVCGKECEADHK